MIIIACLIHVAKVHPQILDWIKDAGTYNMERSNSVAFDDDGNIYVTGRFCGDNIIFDTISLVQMTPHINDGDVFIVKYGNGGNVIWAKSFGGNDIDFGDKIFIDHFDNCIVTAGVWSSNIYSDSNIIASNVPYEGNIMVKYSPGGDILWVRASDNSHNLLDIQEDYFGNLYELGQFEGDSLDLDTITLYHEGPSSSSNLYLAKYDINGQIIIAQIIGRDCSAFFCISNTEDIYIIGEIYDTSAVINDSLLLNTDPTTSDFLISKYTASFNFQWSKKFGQEGHDYVNCAKTDNICNLYISGRFNSDSLLFDQNILLNMSDSDSYGELYYDSYIAKFDIAGNILWAKTYGSLHDDIITGFSFDFMNNCIITGTYGKPSISFDSTILSNTSVCGYANSFVVKLNNNGNVIWAEKLYSVNCMSQSVSTYNQQICLTGHYWGSISYDYTLDSLLSGQGDGDVFVCKIIDTTSIFDVNEFLYNQAILNIYPNPSDYKITIEKTGLNKNEMIYIYNLQGQLFLQQPLWEGKTVIDISGLAKGVYLIRTDGINTLAKIFVKE